LPRIEIRPETASEIGAIREINIAAFCDHPISRQTEHLIVEALRDAGALEVSLVAVSEGRAVGHIAFSKATVGDPESEWFLLGPVAVLPALQGQGVGSALVESGLAELRSRHAVGCVLVGDPGYYRRFGFSTFPDLTYEGVPHEYVLALPFAEAEPRGSIVANAAFEIEPEIDDGRARQEASMRMQGSYSIVAASPEHVPFLPAIERSAASLFGDSVPAALLEVTTPVSVLIAAQREGMLWVALGPDDEPVGFARAEASDARVHVAELDVHPAHGRRGVGTALVRAVEEWARSGSSTEITLTTYRDVPWNAPFYLGLGFEVVPESDWDAELRCRFEQEAGIDSEQAKRVVMRMSLDTADTRLEQDAGS